MAKEAGATPVIADSPGSGYDYARGPLKRTYRLCGMDTAAQEADIEVNWDTTFQTVSYPDGHLTKRLDVITPVVEADGVFNLCKLKTHTYMGMTGAVKNHFGIIPGRTKPGYHAKLRDKDRFANMLLDLAAYVSPRISIMDAVIGMEGDGPNNGDPRHIGLLLAARNPLALDVIASEIIGLGYEDNPVLVEAEKRGLYPTRPEQVDVIGADIADLRIPGFELPTTLADSAGFGRGLTWWQRALSPFFKDSLTIQPQIVKEACIACDACRDACPMKTIAIVTDGKKYAKIDRANCIRCYCCHEMCPQDAVELHRGLLCRIVTLCTP